jgi:hypothetical protein
MPEIPPENLERARAIIDQLHERLVPLADSLAWDAELALEFEPELGE